VEVRVVEYKIGDVLEGEVTGIQPYGAFIKIDDETQGLIHVSEIQSGYTKNIHQVLDVHQIVKVQIIDIDEFSKKISLSLRTLDEKIPQIHVYKKHYYTNKYKKIGFTSIDRNMKQWTREAIDTLTHHEK
jgi:general stress protein 13